LGTVQLTDPASELPVALWASVPNVATFVADVLAFTEPEQAVPEAATVQV
jgi:hypothetical protein